MRDRARATCVAQRSRRKQADERKGVRNGEFAIAIEAESRVVDFESCDQRPVEHANEQALDQDDQMVQAGCALADHGGSIKLPRSIAAFVPTAESLRLFIFRGKCEKMPSDQFSTN